MLPVVFNAGAVKVGLIGQGAALARRVALLAGSGVEARLLCADVSDAVLKPLTLLFVAGLAEPDARRLAGRARALGVLVNCEDMPALCDFHIPAIARRGDLLLTVSTGGSAPGLARVLREWLLDAFGPEWTGRVKEIGTARARWRTAGLGPSEVAQNIRDRIREKGWL
jgi:precorrin-2 dehydrogenase/sirohydrochlorin ferrochelatase